VRRFASVVLVALVGLVSAGCGGGNAPANEKSTGTSSTAASSTVAPADDKVVVPQRATLAQPHPIAIYAAPDGKVVTHLDARTSYGNARTFLVKQITGDWVQVLLPTRPNGSTGWVTMNSIALQPVATSIVVNVATRTITVTIPNQAPLTGTVAVGSKQNPTPTGSFYVTDRVAPEDPHGAYGELALGLSAHSNTLSEFGNGDGQIGIHGTNDPASIGKAVSHGCIRVPEKIVQALKRIPLGTPVMIM
jgi:lipoprotein-anchoring transpeptidase ErfK/SrfK